MDSSGHRDSVPTHAYEPPRVEDLDAGQGPLATAPGIVTASGGVAGGAAPRDL
jgi:hypothetical protein